MRNGSWSSFPPRKWVSTYKISTFCIWIVQSIEKIRCGGSKQILNMLLKGIYFFPRGLVCHKTIIINCVYVFLLTNHVAETSARRIFEADAPCLVPQYSLNIIPVVQFIVKSIWNLHLSRRITILYNNYVIRLEEFSPA